MVLIWIILKSHFRKFILKLEVGQYSEAFKIPIKQLVKRFLLQINIK